MIKANDPSLTSWIEVPEKSDFPVQNLPFGIFSTTGKGPRAATRIGDKVVDLSVLFDRGYLDDIGIPEQVFSQPVLNEFIALGKPVWSATRQRLSELFDRKNDRLKNDSDTLSELLYHIRDVEMLMPVHVGDYTDFYSSIEHATNVGKMFRDPENALLPNWKHIPVGYHGRSSSIVVSGARIHRPKGQTKADDAENPDFGPSRLFDFELEMAFITGRKTGLGESIAVEEAEDAIFGMVIFNDLSARDIQKWEYVPLGPFLSKNFGSVISPWVVTLEALEPFRVEGPVQKPPVLEYLRFKGKKNIDINLEVYLQPDGGGENLLCRSNYKYMYWNMSQQLAHQTVNGCNINVGDMYASGTISGPTPDSYGSMLELSWKGTRPIKLSDGSERKFVLDNDTIIMRGYAEKENIRVGFGESRVKVLPAL
ncbi:MAG: fumarylacetoacetase [bacterium]|jgi:fumarylacetoacetase